MRYGLSFDNWDDSDGVSGEGKGGPRGIFSLLMRSDCSFRFWRTSFATRGTNRKATNARVKSVSMNVHDCVQCSTLRSKTSLSAPFCTSSIKIYSKKCTNEVFMPPFADSKPMWNASESASSANVDITFMLDSCGCVRLLCGPFVASLRAVQRCRGVQV